MTFPANIRFNARVSFPTRVQGSSFITVLKSNGVWTVAPDFSRINVAGSINFTQQFFLYDPANKSYALVNANSAFGALVGQYRQVTSAGDVTILATDSIILMNKAVGAATNINLPKSSSRNGMPLKIKDLKGDANTNNITLVPYSGETIDGFSAAQAVANGVGLINIAYGVKTLFPLSSGGWFSALGPPTGTPGAANGVATLDGTGKVPLTQLPAAVAGALSYQGTWNATTNIPALASGVGTKGYYYKVSFAGTTTLDGNSVWDVGDLAVFNGSTWDRIIGNALPVATASVLGGVLTGTAGSNQWMTGINSSGQPTFSQPGFSNLSGSIAPTQIPAPTAAALGGVKPDTTATINATSGLLSDAVGYRNRVINGDMRVAQRGTSFSSPASGSYTLDRWAVIWTGAAPATVAQVAGPTGYKYALQMTGAASNTIAGIYQRIRSEDTVDLVGKSVTLSANIQASVAQNIAWTLSYANSTDSFGSLTLISSGNFSATTSAQTYSVTINSLPANAANGLQLVLYPQGGSAFTSGTVTITGVQLEPGNQATPFERLPLQVALARCYPYFWSSYGNGVAPGTATHNGMVGQSGAVGSGTYNSYSIRFPTEMRAAPTISTWDGAGTSANGSYTNSSGAWVDGSTGVSSSLAAPTGAVLMFPPTIMSFVHLTANAEL